MNVEFVDTNVLVYAYDTTTMPKHDRARTLVERLWESGNGCLSVQVMQEFFWIATRKIPSPLPPKTVLGILRDYSAWPVFAPSSDDVIAAGELAASARLSYWDAMIVHAAASLGASRLWTEDLQHDLILGALHIENPFQDG